MQLLIFKALATAVATGNLMFSGLATATPASTLAMSPQPTSAIEQATPLDLWIEDLAQLESRGEEHIRILDVNGRYSYGCLQFQLDTFRRFGVKYGLVTDGDNESLRALIYDCDLQKAIAKAMIQDNQANWRHWYTSVRSKKLGPPPTEINMELADAGIK